MRPHYERYSDATESIFPFLFGGTFIEAVIAHSVDRVARKFPFLFGGTFIEAVIAHSVDRVARKFPFLFGGTFIEAFKSALKI